MEYPKLRYLDAFPINNGDGKQYGLRDPSGIAPQTLMLSVDLFYILQFFDGHHSAADIRREYGQAFGKQLPEEHFAEVLSKLDEALFLDNQSFLRKRKAIEREFLSLPARPAVHAGQSYAASADDLVRQIDGFYQPPAGPGFPNGETNGRALKGLVAPHIDIRAGGPCYAHAYKALSGSAEIDCFIILGTGHSGLTDLYSAIEIDFETPLDTARCDLDFMNLLKENYPRIADSEALPHKTEHVIEFQVVFLQHLFRGKRAFTFVPLLCSFSHHALTDARFSRERRLIESFTAALKQTITQFEKRVCLIASVDFCHVGPHYGDQRPPDADFLARVKDFDHELVRHIENLDADAFCQAIAREDDRYRVCGFSSIYTMLKVLEAGQGKLLDYSSTVMDSANSTVTFASMAIL